MRSARVSTASWASSPSARMVMLSPFLAPSVMILSELFAFASRSPLTTTMSDENCLAALTNCAAGRACSPSSGPTVVSLSATYRSSPPATRHKSGARAPTGFSLPERGCGPLHHGAEKKRKNREMVAGRGGLRCLFDCFDPGGRVRGEESLGIDRERDLALRGGVVPARDLQRPLDALGLHHHPETRGAAAHLNGDPYHLPTSLLLRITTPTSVRAAFTPTATQCRPSLLQPGNRRINNRTQFTVPGPNLGRTKKRRAHSANGVGS